MPNVGYATLQIIPSVRGITEDIRRQLAPAAGEGERAGQETGRGFGEAFRAGLAAIGLTAAASKITEGVGEAVTDAIDQSGVPGRLKAQLGSTGPIAAQYGDIAGRLYAGAVTDSVETAAEDIRALAGSGLLPPRATQAQIKQLTTEFADFTSTFEQDSSLTAQAIAAMVKNGLAKDGTAALDLLTRGFQKFGPRAEDLVETMQEYPVQLRKLGLDGKTTLGLLGQALQGGARDTDIAADAVKEFSIRSIDMSAGSQAAYKGLGLSAKDMSLQIAKGGTGATAGLQTVLDKLRGIKDPVKQSQLAVGLFGTQAEDLGKALYSLDPRTAVKAIGDVGGAADRMGTDLRDNAGARITQFKRGLQQGLVRVIGGEVLPRLLAVSETVQTRFGPTLSRVAGVLARNVGPALDAAAHFLADDLVPALQTAAGWVQRNSRSLEIAAGIVTAIMLPVLITLAVGWATSAAAAVASGATQVGAWVTTAGSAVVSAATQLVASYRTVGGWLLMGATAIASGARVVGVWLLTAAAATAGALTQGLAAAGVVAGWIWMGLQSLLGAARIAAAWFIALGPVGWAIAAVLGIAAIVILNWTRIRDWTVRIWTAVSTWVTTAASTIIGWLRANWPLLLAILTGPIGLATLLIVRNWNRISAAFAGAYRATVSTGRSLVTWVGGLPARIGAGLANLGGRLYTLATGAFGQLQTAAAEKTGLLLADIAALPGRITTWLGDLSTLLYSAGQDLVRGLLGGIASKAKDLAHAAAGLGKSALDSVSGALHIGSPSKKMAELGRWAGLGLVQGLTGTTAQVTAASKKVADLVRQAFAEATAAQIATDRRDLSKLGKSKADQIRAAALRRDIASQQRIAHAGQGLARLIAADNARLAVLAKQRDGVAAKLKAAQDRLADITRSAADLRNQVASGITQAAGITRALPEDTKVTAASVLGRLRGDVKAAQLFAAQLLGLRRKGLSADLVNQIASAGVEGGEATAAALNAATPAQIKAINAQQAGLAKAAAAAGTITADAMYGSGIRAAQGLVDGLKKQQGAIVKQMLAIAKAMQTAIREALGIHSPSRVAERIGAFFGLGLIRGVDGQRAAVDAAMRRLVAVPAAPALDPAAGRGTIRGGGPAVVNIAYHAPTPENPHKAALEISRRTLAAVSI